MINNRKIDKGSFVFAAGLLVLFMAVMLLAGRPLKAAEVPEVESIIQVGIKGAEVPDVSDECVEEEIKNDDLPVPPSIEVHKSSVILNKYKSKKLDAEFEGAKKEDIIWSSSNKRVATVSSNGKIKAKKVGKATITARIKGTAEKDTCKVEVVHYKKYRVRATGYCNCAACSGPGHPHTASGTVPKQGRTIAVDRRKIPFGSKVEIRGHMYRAEDCGSAIKGNRIDIYFASHSRATRFGVQYLTIKVYKKK